MSTNDARRHLEPSRLAAMAAGANDSELESAQRHLRDCAGCRAELALAQAFVQAPDSELPDAIEDRMRTRLHADLGWPAPATNAERERSLGRTGRAWWQMPYLRWLSLATLLLASFLTWQLLDFSGDSRRTDEERVTDSTAWAPTVAITDGELRIAWTALAEADLYRVRVLTVGGRVVWETETTALSAALMMGAPQQGLEVRIQASGPSDFQRESDPAPLPAPN